LKPAIVYSDVKAGLKIRRKILVIAALMFAGATARVAVLPEVQKPVTRFIYFYEQSNNMDFVQRVAFSLLMAKTNLTEATLPSL
jgi:hypothetical protein